MKSKERTAGNGGLRRHKNGILFTLAMGVVLGALCMGSAGVSAKTQYYSTSRYENADHKWEDSASLEQTRYSRRSSFTWYTYAEAYTRVPAGSYRLSLACLVPKNGEGDKYDLVQDIYANGKVNPLHALAKCEWNGATEAPGYCAAKTFYSGVTDDSNIRNYMWLDIL